jgi:serine protease Do
MRPERRRATTIRCLGVERSSGLAWLAFALVATWLPAVDPVRAGEISPTTDVLLKVKPAVVIVTTKVSGEVRLTCPNGAPQRVVPEPIQAHGTGFLITANGYLVTNGHVVQPYYDPNESELRGTLLRQAIEQACVPQDLPEQRKRVAVSSLTARLAKSADVELRKSLTVVLSNRDTFVADVKAYSPPLAERAGKEGAAGRGPLTESGKDVAILKIDARNLPTLPLGDSDRVQLGQPIHLLGFPGVVMYHDLLDKRSAVEASITAGQISSVKRDARGAPVIQTDAAATWGNSGGPAIDDRGHVVGVLTFISLTSDDTQAIQGFNFLVPANIVREFARTAGADLGAASPFNAVWHDAVDRFSRKDWGGAQAKLDAAARLVPNLPDVRRLQAETEIRLLQDKRLPLPLVLGAGAMAVLAIVGGACWWGWRRRRAGHAPAMVVVHARESESVHPVVRVSAPDLVRALAQRTDLVIVDVREPSAYEESSVQAKGAIRASAADIVQSVSALAREQGIVLYCNLPGEAASAEAARLLMAEGYTRVAVLAGGFAAWEADSLPLERTPHAHGMANGARPALPVPRAGAAPSMEVEVDIPVGVKGGGPYFNARATRLGLGGLSLRSPAVLTVGQRVRLTVFLAGESLEIGGQVVTADSAVGNGEPCTAEVSFDTLPEHHATVLEGLILAQRTTR